jgi:hypothetical protein
VPVDPGASRFFATVGAQAEVQLRPVHMFIQVPEERVCKNRLHADLIGSELEPEVARAVSLGARHVGDFDEYGTVWTTLSDPEGNLFDISAR